MKKISVVVALVAVLGMAAPLFGEANSHYEPGDFSISVGAGFGYATITLLPGIDINFGEFKIVPGWGLDWGLMARGIIGFGGSYSVFGAGAYFMLHFGLNNIGIDFLKNLDFYWGPGLSFTTTPAYWTTYYSYLGGSYRNFGFSTLGGTAYFLSPNVSLFAEYSYYGVYSSYTVVGISFKL